MIHLSRGGTNYGPYDEPYFRELITRGLAVPGDFYWREGMERWQPVAEYLRSAGLSAPSPAGELPETYLALSILITLFCCPLTGIPAIVYASSVVGKTAAGDLAGASAASRKACLWCAVSFLLALGLLLLSLAL